MKQTDDIVTTWYKMGRIILAVSAVALLITTLATFLMLSGNGPFYGTAESRAALDIDAAVC